MATTKRILYVRPDGGLSVIIPSPNSQRVGESEWDWLDRIATRRIAACAPVLSADQQEQERLALEWAALQDRTQVEVATIPSDRTFRDAWELGGAGRIRVNLAKARAIHKARLLERQQAKLAHARLDLELAEDSADAEAIQAARDRCRRLRALRASMATDLDALTTAAAIAAYLPADLQDA